MLARTRELTEKFRDWYAAFEFHRVYHAVNEFAIVDLSSFYLDVLKDRMYTFAPTSKERRSAQTVLWKITEALVRLVAPILSFTADEVWEYLPKLEGRKASVHLAQFPKPEEIFSAEPTSLLDTWKALFSIRNEALRILEDARQVKMIGKALEADLEVTVQDATFEFFSSLSRQDHKEFFNVSAVTIRKPDSARFSGTHGEQFRSRTLAKGFRSKPALPPAINAPAAGISCLRSATTASGRMFAYAASRHCAR